MRRHSVHIAGHEEGFRVCKKDKSLAVMVGHTQPFGGLSRTHRLASKGYLERECHPRARDSSHWTDLMVLQVNDKGTVLPGMTMHPFGSPAS